MVRRILLLAMLLASLTPVLLMQAPSIQAKERPSYEKATLVSMEAVRCGYSEKSGESVAGTILGTDSEHKKNEELLCQEYILQADRLTYRIRAKDKHPKLLPIGEEVEFRIHNDKLLLRIREIDDKEREFSVMSITPRKPDDQKAASKTKPQ